MKLLKCHTIFAFFCFVQTLTQADPVILKESVKEFPTVLPDEAIGLIKVYDAAADRLKITSNSTHITSAKDLNDLIHQERANERAKYGAVSENLKGKFQNMQDSESIEVLIALKYPVVQYLDKTKHSEEDMKQQSLAVESIHPVQSLDSFLEKNGLQTKRKYSNAMAVCEMSKIKIKELMFDSSVAVIEEHRSDELMSSPLSSLATSAYNPAASMPTDARGAGINAATFEMGLTQSFLNCAGLSPSLWDSDPNPPEHSLATFRTLAYAAPSANLYHRWSIVYYGVNDSSYLINNGIRTVSLSAARGSTSPYRATYKEFRIMDDFAYRYPYTVFNNGSANAGYDYETNWQCYNAISVGNVRHTNQSYYELAGCTQTKNPPPRYGGCISGSGSNCSGDREMPYIVTPGIPPSTSSDFTDGCLGNRPCGTSYSAPTTNGIVACVLSADSRMTSWPEKVRAVLLATSHNVYGSYWNSNVDGRDGAGVISGTDAVALARNHTSVYPGGTAAEHGVYASSLYASNDDDVIQFNIKVPNPKPAGKHLRVVLTWDSNPVINSDVNDLSDLDLLFTSNGGTQHWSLSYDGNVEMVDVDASSLTAGSTYAAKVYVTTVRIPSGARANFFYYSAAWTWVKDHAD